MQAREENSKLFSRVWQVLQRGHTPFGKGVDAFRIELFCRLKVICSYSHRAAPGVRGPRFENIFKQHEGVSMIGILMKQPQFPLLRNRPVSTS